MAIWGVPGVTSAILNNGYVGIYWKNPTGTVLMLPVVGYTGDPAQKMIFALNPAGGQITIEQSGMDSYVNSPLDRFRYILIPAGVNVSGVGRATDIDWSRVSYTEATQMLGLTD